MESIICKIHVILCDYMHVNIFFCMCGCVLKAGKSKVLKMNEKGRLSILVIEEFLGCITMSSSIEPHI